jgi:hypothetical protein
VTALKVFQVNIRWTKFLFEEPFFATEFRFSKQKKKKDTTAMVQYLLKIKNGQINYSSRDQQRLEEEHEFTNAIGATRFCWRVKSVSQFMVMLAMYREKEDDVISDLDEWNKTITLVQDSARQVRDAVMALILKERKEQIQDQDTTGDDEEEVAKKDAEWRKSIEKGVYCSLKRVQELGMH